MAADPAVLCNGIPDLALAVMGSDGNHRSSLDWVAFEIADCGTP
jgi:hypothetical protein